MNTRTLGRRARPLFAVWLTFGLPLAALAQPTVTVRSPARNALSAPRPTNVALTFSQAMNSATDQNLRVFSAQRGGKKSGAYTTVGNTITFNPSTDFRPGEKIQVVVPASVTSLGGQAAVKQVHEFWAAATGGSGTFAATPLTLQGAPTSGVQSVALGDVTGDGRPDMVTFDEVNAFVTVRPGNGIGGFGAAVNRPVDANNEEGTLADADSDGDLDLLVVHTGPDRVSVHLNNGAGVFSAGSSTLVPFAGYNYKPVVGDIDADGDLDFVVQDFHGDQIFIRLNDGAGGFTSAPNLPTGTHPFDVSLTDVDNDGDLDITLSHGGIGIINEIVVRRNNASGVFGAATTVATSPKITQVRVVDLNGDGNLDLLHFNSTVPGDWQLQTRLNDGTGVFTLVSAADVNNGYGGEAVEVADFDGDGDLDVVLSGDNKQQTMLNRGNGTFENSITEYDPNLFNANRSASADLDGDGDVDIVRTDRQRPTGRILLNQAPITVTAVSPTRNRLAAPRASNPTITFSANVAPATADEVHVFGAQAGGRKPGAYSSATNIITFNPTTDFKPGEQVSVSIPRGVESTTGSPVKPHVYQFTAAATGGSATFAARPNVPLGATPNPIELGDFNEDGHLDLIAGSLDDDVVNVRFGDGTGGFSGNLNLPFNNPNGLVVADMNTDSNLDILVVGSDGPTLWLGNGDGTFQAPKPVGADGLLVNHAVAADVDGDADLDVLISVNGQVKIAYNEVSGEFPETATVPTQIGSRDISCADVDGDGDLDLLVANTLNNTVSVHRNNGSGAFGAGTAVAVGAFPELLVVNDLDGDGDVDFAVANTNSFTISLGRNNGSGTFTISGTLATAVTPGSLALADLDGDTDLDLLTRGVGSTAVWRNNGLGAFTAGTPVSASANSRRLTTGDLDSDGDIDFIQINSNGFAQVRLNQDAFQVTAVSPARHDANAPRGANVALTFNKNVNNATANRIRVWGGMRGGKKAGAYSTAANVLTFSSATNFAPGELVNVTVPGTVVSSGGELARKHVYQYTAAVTGGQATFTPAALGAASGPAAITALLTADVNNDGSLDLLAYHQTENIELLLGNGDGTFGTGTFIGTLAQCYYMTVADLDNDGDLDLLIADYANAQVLVRLNSAGSFAAPVPVSVSANPLMIATGDVDGDGDLDFVSTGLGGANVRFNNGSGGFSGAGSGGLASARGVALGDLDGDGDLDAVTASADLATVRFNNGSGVFGGGYPVSVGLVPATAKADGVLLGDLDGDGDLDLAVNNSTENLVAIRLNDGTGQLSGTLNLTAGAFAYDAALGDFDGDGDLDLVVANAVALTSKLWLNNGDATFITGAPVGAITAEALALGDVDNDGDLDILATNEDGGFVSVQLNDNAFTVTARAPERHTATTPTFGDVNLTLSEAINPLTASQLRVFGSQSSGRKSGVFAGIGTSLSLDPLVGFAPGELVSVTARATIKTVGNLKNLRPHVYQFRAKATGGSGSFVSAPDVPVVNNPGQGAAADLNGDGFVDIIIPNYLTDNVSVALGNGDGTFAAPTTVAVDGHPSEALALDVDADGDLDLITTNFTTDNLSIRFNNGNGAFSGTGTVAVGHAPKHVSAGDVDGDGDLDLVVAGFYAEHSLSVCLNNGSGIYGVGPEVLLPATPSDVALGDVDNDGDLDLVAPLATADVAVALNQGFGTFDAPTTRSINPMSRSLALADIDADGDLDLLISFDSGTVSLHRNTGAGAFGPATTFSVGTLPVVVLATDLDGDTDLDLVTANYANIPSSLSVRLNDGTGTFAAVPDLLVGFHPFGLMAADLDNDGDVDLLAANQGDNTVSVRLNSAVAGPAPTLLSFTPDHGVTGTVVTISGTNFAGTTAVTFDGVAAPGFVVNGAGTEITVSSPPATFNGPIAVTTPDGTVSSATDFGVDLVILAAETIPAGDFHHITVTATGVATLGGAVEATAPVLVQTGGELADGSNVLSGAGDFTLEAGATLRLRHPLGLGATGALQLNGGLTLDVGATYIYQAALAQVTGTNLPAEVRNLTIDNAAGVSLTQGVNIRQVLTMAGAGDFSLNGQPLTLLSDAAGTALVANPGASQVAGDATAQVWLNNVPNAGLDYRHLSSPTKTSTVADLTTPGFTPAANPAYNVSETPLAIKPYPNVFGFDEGRFPGSPLFISGYYSPTSLASALGVGEGYTAYIKGGLTPDFTGELSQGSVTRANLGRTGNGVKTGWQLIGNPYPSPLDWDLVAVPTGLNPSISVYKSTGVNTGVYLTRANGLGTLPNGVVPMGQAFFARVDVAPVNLTFTNAARVTTFGSAAHYRAAPDTRPVVQLSLQAVGAAAVETDGAVVYFQEGATAEVDRLFDGAKPAHNPGLPTLVSLTTTGTELAVNGLAETALTAGTVVELLLDLPAAGRYELAVARVANMAGTEGVLLDRLTGTRYALGEQPVVAVSAQTVGEMRGRFALVFGVANRTVTSSLLALYPNPARSSTRLTGAAAGAAVTVLDATGRVVLTATADADGVAMLAGAKLTAGVYVVRCGTQAQRLVIE